MFLARLVLRNAHQLTFLSSYEAILLAPGENKIDVDVDTRKFPQAHDSSQKAYFRNQKKLTMTIRSPLRCYLHFPQGGPHPRQHAPHSSAEDFARYLLRLPRKELLSLVNVYRTNVY